MIKYLLSIATITSLAFALQPEPSATPPESAANKFMHQADFHELVARSEGPARSEWQKPELVITSLGSFEGKTVADIGAGTGYFSFPIAAKAAKVIAIDIDNRFLDSIDHKKQTQNIGVNIETRSLPRIHPGPSRGKRTWR